MLQLKTHHYLHSADERIFFMKTKGDWVVGVLAASSSKIQDAMVLEKYKMKDYKTYKNLRKELEKNFIKESISIPDAKVRINNKYSLKDYPGFVISKVNLKQKHWKIVSYSPQISEKQALELYNFSAETRHEAVEFLEKWLKHHKIKKQVSKACN